MTRSHVRAHFRSMLYIYISKKNWATYLNVVRQAKLKYEAIIITVVFIDGKALTYPQAKVSGLGR